MLETLGKVSSDGSLCAKKSQSWWNQSVMLVVTLI